jgi:predicted metal-dependent enzyme (double-stranded beta helix superfamily)
MITPGEFVSQCMSCIEAGGSAQDIAALMLPALASQAAQPDLWGKQELLHRSDRLFIVDLTLPPFGTSAAHDHSTWAVIGISSGCEIDYFYERSAQGLTYVREQAIHAGEACVLHEDTIHAIANAGGEPARGLHVYGRDLSTAPRSMWDPHTARESRLAMDQFVAWEKQLTERSKAAGRPLPPHR